LSQASKGVRRMPWHREAMKDVATCDKPRFAGSKLPVDLRMGKPRLANPGDPAPNKIGAGG